jgi:hypothetical protein
MQDIYQKLKIQTLENIQDLASLRKEIKSDVSHLRVDSKSLKNDLLDIRSGICQLKPKFKICL